MNSGLTSTLKKLNNKVDQTKTPLATALEKECLLCAVPLDVPGHKGNIKELKEYYGEKAVFLDKNSRPSIDNICQPTGVIKEAEELAAIAFGASHAFFMTNGTTSAVQTMVMSAIFPGEKIIMPRNVHVSVINAVILAGGVPVYVDPSVHVEYGIPLGMKDEDILWTIKNNPDAKAVLVNNPTYYGVCSNLKKIVEFAHNYKMKVLVDEAHGTHFYFGDHMPINAMKAGADYSAVSMHKTGGSLTQSSLLLISNKVDSQQVRKIINLTVSTSASYLLLSSIDIARKKLACEGRSLINKLCSFVSEGAKEISKINGLKVLTRENMIKESAVYDYDPTKLAVNTVGTGLAGIEVYNLLKEEYNIQLEFGDISNILALPAVGDSENYSLILAKALADIVNKHGNKQTPGYFYEYIKPIVKIPPRDAFYFPQEEILFEDCEGRISGEYVMCYPPGIPLLAPGELITKEILAHIDYSKKKGCKLIGGNGEITQISVVK